MTTNMEGEYCKDWCPVGNDPETCRFCGFIREPLPVRIIVTAQDADRAKACLEANGVHFKIYSDDR